MELRILYENILTSVWLNGGSKNILIAGGMPQYITKYHPLVLIAKEAGVNLFVPKYPGSWESSGTFSVRNSTKSIENIIDLIRSGEGIELYTNSKVKWTSDKIYLFGISFGGIPSLLNNKKVDKTILINPFINLEVHKQNNGEDIKKTFSFIKRAYKNVYLFNISRLMKELSDLKYPKMKEKFLLIRGVNDELIPKEEIQWLRNKYNPDYLEVEQGHSINFNNEIMKRIFEG